jgi:NAD(P)-dependent dehydrogenase (short-subunit alcohol dehydrogenase family)
MPAACASDERQRDLVMAGGAAGATVLACDADPAVLRRSYGEPAAGGEIRSVVIDNRNEEESAKLAERLADEGGRLDVLVINDTHVADQPLIDVSEADWDALIAANVTSAFLSAKQLVPLMIPARYGKVVFTTGPETTFAIGGRAPLSAARHAVFGFAKDLALEMRQHQINVNLACPAAHIEDEGEAAGMARDALVHTVLWLSSDASRFVTGTLVRAEREARGSLRTS